MENKKNLWTQIVSKLKNKNLTISTMESCTSGDSQITNISGASSVFKEGYVTYCNEAKIKQGVPAEVIEKYTVYSSETAIAMAKAVKEQANSDFGIGVTGQFGRIDPNNPVDKINCVWYAIVNPENKNVVSCITVPTLEREVQKKYVIDEIAKTLYEHL